MDDYSGVSHDSDSFLPERTSPRPIDETVYQSSRLTQERTFPAQPRLLTEKVMAQDEMRISTDFMPLRVEPLALNFEHIHPGTLYVMSFSVQNATRTSHRIRIEAPKTGVFSLSYIPAGNVAPGMDTRAEIECMIPEDADEFYFLDRVTVMMDKYKVQIPLMASKPSPDIVFDKHMDLGILSQGEKVSKEYVFENRGTISGHVTINSEDDSMVRFEPSSFDVDPDETRTIKVSFHGEDLGPFREIIKVNITGVSNQMIVDVSAQVVQHRVMLLYPNGDGTIDQIDIGGILFGQERTVHGILANNGPQPVAFNVLFPDEPERDPSYQAPQTDGEDAPPPTPGANFVEIEPSEGMLKPFSQIPVKIIIAPTAPAPSKGFEKNFFGMLRNTVPLQSRPLIDIPEIGTKLNLNIQGTAVFPHVLLSPQILRFGDCMIGERKDAIVTMENKLEQDIDFKLTVPAHFKITPSSGTIYGNQKQTLIVSFLPTQMGNQKCVAKVSFADGIYTREIKLLGHGLYAPKRELIGGIDKLPEDFAPKYQFVEAADLKPGAQSAEAQKHKVRPMDSKEFLSSTSWDVLYDSKSQVSDAKTKTGVYDEVLEEKKKNHTIYNDYLKSSRNKRENDTLKKKKAYSIRLGCADRDDPYGTDMGMARGLDEPELKIPIGGEPLWLLKGPGQEAGGQKMAFDENRLVSKKYPLEPKTAADARDCQAELELDEQRLITASHQVINFGEVNYTSVSWKNFAISNNLSKPIHLRLENLEGEISMTKPPSQVIPPGATAGFDVCFNAKDMGSFKKYFIWTVNGFHSHKVSVLADVIPIQLNFDRTNIDMRFPDGSLESSIEEDIVVSNPGNAVAEYMFGKAGDFECIPESGTVAPGDSAMVKVHWQPKGQGSSEGMISVHITGGNDVNLNCIGHLDPVTASFKDKKLEFGEVAVGSSKKIKTVIKNTGNFPAVFNFDENIEEGMIQVVPDRGQIDPGDSQRVDITLSPNVAKSFDRSVIKANIRGGKMIQLKLAGKSLIPTMKMEQNSFSFQEVAVGATQCEPMTIINNSTITATAVLDFGANLDFQASILDDDDRPRPIDRSGSDNIMDLSGCMLSYAVELGHRSEVVGGKYKIAIPAGQTFRGGLIYSPTVAREHNFQLPINIDGLPDDISMRRAIKAKGVACRLKLSRSVVDFGDRVVPRDANARMSFFKEIQVTNIDRTKPIVYSLVEDPIKELTVQTTGPNGEVEQPLFFVSPMQGELGPGESEIIRVTFLPRTATQYETALHLYIEDQPVQKIPYLVLPVVGSGIFPRLEFSEPRVMMPTVPLGVVSKAMFLVVSEGYDSLEVSFRVSPTIPVTLDVEFPDGKNIGLARPQLRVVVSYKSDQPVSWVGKLEFADADGEKFPLELSGCTDNSILSNHSFLSSYTDRYGLVQIENQHVKMGTKGQIADILEKEAARKEELRRQRQIERQKLTGMPVKENPAADKGKKKAGEGGERRNRRSEPEGTDLTREMQPVPDADIVMLLKWLNSFVCRTPIDIKSFPQCIVDCDGEVAFACIEQLSGKRSSSNREATAMGTARTTTGGHSDKQKIDPAAERMRALDAQINVYRSLLTQLISDGAMLNHIHPAALMPEKQCIQALELELSRIEGPRMTQSMLEKRHSIWSRNWYNDCKFAWTEVLYQAVKVYCLSRITYKEYTKTAGVKIVEPRLLEDEKGSKKKKPSMPPQYRASNVYSVNEQVLLSWAKYHCHRAFSLPDQGQRPGTKASQKPKEKQLLDFLGDFANLFPVLQILHSHVPELSSNESALQGYTTGDFSKVDQNFPKLMLAFKEIRQDWELDRRDMTSSRANFILLMHLFFSLPSLVPKTTIDFVGKLGGPIIKTIELRNPSKKPVVYDVVLDGSKDFSIDKRMLQITLDPQSTFEYPVILSPRFPDEVNARITFWPIRQDGVSGTTLVFNLVSKITGRKPAGTESYKVALFEHKMFPITVQNPFDKECTFPIRTEQTFIPADLGSLINPGKKKKGRSAGVRRVPTSSIASSGSEEGAAIEKVLLEPFWPAEDKIVLAEGMDQTVNIHVLPFEIGTYTCELVFRDSSKGEFCHTISIEVGLPNPETIDFKSEVSAVGMPAEKLLKFSSKNLAFDRACTFVAENRLPNALRPKARPYLGDFLASREADSDTGVSTYVVHVNSPYFSCPKDLKFMSEYLPLDVLMGGVAEKGSKASAPPPSRRTGKQNKTIIEDVGTGATSNIPNALRFAFFPEKAGVYRSRLVCFPADNERDLRVIDLTAKASVPMNDTVFEFRGAARQELMQEIPITNDSDEVWNLSGSCTGIGFSSPSKFTIQPGETVVANITFVGPYSGEFEGKFMLVLPGGDDGTPDTFEYRLLGIADDPLAEEHLVFRCKARTRETFKIPMKKVQMKPPGDGGKKKNLPSASAGNYAVETDIPHISGPPEISMSASHYEFSVKSPQGGLMSGSITFTDPVSGTMIWYTMNIEVTSPECESNITVESEVRKAVAVEISLDNPSSETLMFQVVLRGEGLLGDATYELPPGNDAKPFELIYSPLRAGKFQGSISFLNDQVGEFWYSVDLTASPAPPTDVPPLEVMIGDTQGVSLTLENPLGEPVTYDVEISDPKHFIVSPAEITLGPFEQGEFQVAFRPSSFTQEEHAEVILSHPSLGYSNYLLTGIGLLPGMMPTQTINAIMGEIGSKTIVFRNPFPHPLPVDIVYAHDINDLDNSASISPRSPGSINTRSPRSDGGDGDLISHSGEPAFSLLLKKTSQIVIQPETTLQIGVSFSPTKLGVYKGFVQVRSNVNSRALLWCYPLTGVTEVGTIQYLPLMKSQCKTSIMREVILGLDGLSKNLLTSSPGFSVQDFTIKTEIENPELKKCVQRAFRIVPINLTETSDVDRPALEIGVKCRILFEPLIEMNTSIEIILSNKIRGQWRSQVALESTPPDPDDVIELVAPVGGEDQVSFRLSNRFLGFSQFTAFFEMRSSPHFSCTPTSGVLAPYGSSGTSFVVSYTPMQYGMNDTAFLTIRTDEAQWRYKLVAGPPPMVVSHAGSPSNNSRRMR